MTPEELKDTCNDITNKILALVTTECAYYDSSVQLAVLMVAATVLAKYHNIPVWALHDMLARAYTEVKLTIPSDNQD